MDDLAERRARLVRRQLAAGAAVEAARSVVVLHASDPATVYLSVLARCPALTVEDVAREMYGERRLVRMLAMRRTLFVVPAELVPVVHAAASLDVAATQRRRLLKQLTTIPTEPAVPDDVAAWLADVEAGTAAALERLGVASGAELARAEPRLRTALLPTTEKSYDVRRAVTTQVLTLMGAEGSIVRGRPLGAWTSRQHTWEPATAWWPDGIETVEPAQARARLVEHYLRRFGPATEADVTWWTGWPKGTTRQALAALDTVERAGGLVLADDDGRTDHPEPTASLLPALDPTPMGGSSATGSCRRAPPRSTTPTATSAPPSGGAVRWSAAGRCERTGRSRRSSWPIAAWPPGGRWRRRRSRWRCGWRGPWSCRRSGPRWSAVSARPDQSRPGCRT